MGEYLSQIDFPSMINQVLVWIRTLPEPGIHLFLFLSAIIENIFPPWPGDTFIAFSGFLYADSTLSLAIALCASSMGSLTGAWIMYFAGHGILLKIGSLLEQGKVPELFRITLEGLTSQESLDKTRRWFEHSGFVVVIFSRFSAGVRFFVSIVAGISDMNFWFFSFAFFLGVILWNGLLVAGGYTLRENWESLLYWLKIYNSTVIVIVLISLALWLLYRFIKYQKEGDRHAGD